MNDELQKALAELLGKANNGIDTASDFLASELPEVIQQMLMWHGVYNFILFILSIIFLLLGVTMVSKVILNSNDENHWVSNQYGSTSDAGVICLISSVFIFTSVPFMMNMQWLQIWIAPKVWLIEYAANLAS